MLASVCPKLPMVDATATRTFYQEMLGFSLLGNYSDYLMLTRDGVELHFFAFSTLVPARSDFMAYIRVADIDTLYAELAAKFATHPAQGTTPAELRPLQTQPWGMREFSVVDPSGTCLTFGEGV